MVVPLAQQLQTLETILAQHIATTPGYKVIVFFATARNAGFVAELFTAAGYNILEVRADTPTQAHKEEEQEERKRKKKEKERKSGGTQAESKREEKRKQHTVCPLWVFSCGSFLISLSLSFFFPFLLACQIHSRKSQSHRTRVADQFRAGSNVCLFSSDVSVQQPKTAKREENKDDEDQWDEKEQNRLLNRLHNEC